MLHMCQSFSPCDSSRSALSPASALAMTCSLYFPPMHSKLLPLARSVSIIGAFQAHALLPVSVDTLVLIRSEKEKEAGLWRKTRAKQKASRS